MSIYNFNTVPQPTRTSFSAEPQPFSHPLNPPEYPDDPSAEQHDFYRPRMSSQPPMHMSSWPAQSAQYWQEPHASASISSSLPPWSLASTSDIARSQEPYMWQQSPSSYPTPVSSTQGTAFVWPLAGHTVPSNGSPLPSRSVPWQKPPEETMSTKPPVPPPPAGWSTPKKATIPLVPPRTSPASAMYEQSPGSSDIPEKGSSREKWMLRGSCACSFVQYELSARPGELPLQACYCHCAMCRNLSGSNYIAFTSVPTDRLRWFTGIWDWKAGHGAEITDKLQEARDTYEYGKMPGFSVVKAGKKDAAGKSRVDPHAAPWEMDIDAQAQAMMEMTNSSTQIPLDEEPAIRLWSSSRKAVRGSCARCGSTLFISYHSNVQTTDITLGTLWTSEDKGRMLVKPVMHIMLREKALWEDVPEDGLTRHQGMPGEAEGWRDKDGGRKKKEMTTEERMKTLRHLAKCVMVY